MKLSRETIEVLKNFSAINSNIVIKPGNVIKTMAEAKNILANATVEETFTDTMGIYDLPEFLLALSMFDDPDLNFDPDMKFVVISKGLSKIKYYFSSPEILTSPDKDVKMPSADVSFVLSEVNLNDIRRAVSALKVSDLSITVDDGNLIAVAKDVKDKTSNSFTIDLGSKVEGDFNLVFSVANLRLLAVPGDYAVEISSKLISKFSNTLSSVEYFVALEKSSSFK